MDEDLSAVLSAAAAGDTTAWNRIVDRFGGLVWSVARGFGLSTADASDVVQSTWLRLVERIETVREPDRLGGWLATTARREALRLLSSAARVMPASDFVLDRAAPDTDPSLALLSRERDRLLWRAFDELGETCRRLLRTLMADPPPSYAEAAAALDIPVGSIGPTRARCLVALRQRHTAGEARG